MQRVRILDCTLRDGGYCNQWKFGYENTKKIIDGLVESGVDIIECGFLYQSFKIPERYNEVYIYGGDCGSITKESI